MTFNLHALLFEGKVAVFERDVEQKENVEEVVDGIL